ncbi:unnamed protein product [Closterium sp. NIES-65]|nr:unnamed protein product [Closterium sp. NIES-65]
MAANAIARAFESTHESPRFESIGKLPCLVLPPLIPPPLSSIPLFFSPSSHVRCCMVLHGARGRTEALLQEVAAAPPSLRTVCLLDEMSDTLCRVLDAAELCRNVHPNSGGGCATVRREFVDAANEAFVKLSTYVQALNSNQQLYRLLVAAIQAMPPAPAASASSPPPGRNSRPQGAGRAAAGAGGEREEVLREAHRVAQLLRLDFERGGVHLPDGEDSCQKDSRGVPKRALSVTAVGQAGVGGY